MAHYNTNAHRTSHLKTGREKVRHREMGNNSQSNSLLKKPLNIGLCKLNFTLFWPKDNYSNQRGGDDWRGRNLLGC